VVSAFAVFYCATIPASLAVRASLVAVLLLGLAGMAWFNVLVEDERLVLQSMVLRRSKAAA